MGRVVTETDEDVTVSYSEDLPDEIKDIEKGVEAEGSDEEILTREKPNAQDLETPQGNEANLAEEYRPNFKYNVLDDEKEMPEEYRRYISSKDDEDRLRDLFTKADSVDYWKQKVSKSDDARLSMEQQYNSVSSALESIKKLAKNDFTTLSQLLEIPEDALIDHTRRLLDLEEMPEHDRRRYEEDQQIRAQNFIAQQQLQYYQQQQQQQVISQHQQRLNEAFTRPEISAFQREFDSRMGEGSFKQHCMDYGNTMYQQTRTNIDPMRCVDDTYNKFKNLIPITTSDSVTVTSQNHPQEKPIPRVGDRMNVAPTKRRARSIEDIKKEYAARFG